MKNILIVISLFLSSFATAKDNTISPITSTFEYTEDTKPEFLCKMNARETRMFVFRMNKKHQFNECKKIWKKNIWFKCWSECKERGLGKNVGGGCGHLLGQSYKCSYNPGKPKHCEAFRYKPEISLFQEIEEILADYCVKKGFQAPSTKKSNKSLEQTD